VTEVDADPGFAMLTAKISAERGFGCASYKQKCLRRRIAVRMRAKGVHSYADYMAVLDREPAEYERLLDALTINVTKLFRNWETFDSIRRNVVPALWSTGMPIRAWSAGCSSGEETYSLAALFHAHAEERGEGVRLASRLTVIGTDIDRESLAAASRGTYEEAAFADTPVELRRRYFSAAPPHEVVPELRQATRFERRDLLREPAPGSAFQLITCRNVIIYFDRGTQEALFERFFDALAPGGFLVLGKVETLLGIARSRFAPVDARERIFRRPA
jgi:chemotaxis methyl-accepting protein methylase